jgi:hypothetical protein
MACLQGNEIKGDFSSWVRSDASLPRARRDLSVMGGENGGIPESLEQGSRLVVVADPVPTPARSEPGVEQVQPRRL